MNAVQEILSFESFLNHVKKVDEIWGRPPTSIIFPIEFEDVFSDVSLKVPRYAPLGNFPCFIISNPPDSYLYKSPFDKKPEGRLAEDIYKSARRFLEISDAFSWGSIKLENVFGAEFPLKFLRENSVGSFVMTSLKKYFDDGANPYSYEKLGKAVEYLESKGYKAAYKGRGLYTY